MVSNRFRDRFVGNGLTNYRFGNGRSNFLFTLKSINGFVNLNIRLFGALIYFM